MKCDRTRSRQNAPSGRMSVETWKAFVWCQGNIWRLNPFVLLYGRNILPRPKILEPETHTWHNCLNVLSMSSMFWVVNRMLELVGLSLKELNWCEFGLIWFGIDLWNSKTWNQILQVFFISQSYISKTDNISLQLLQTPSKLYSWGHTNVDILVYSLQQLIQGVPSIWKHVPL